MKELRINKGYTQEYMAKMLNIKQSSYCLKENGHRSFKIKELLKLQEIFKVSLDDLLKANKGVN